MILVREFLEWEQEYFNQQMGKHGDCGGYTSFQEYINSFTSYELLLKMIWWQEDEYALPLLVEYNGVMIPEWLYKAIRNN